MVNPEFEHKDSVFMRLLVERASNCLPYSRERLNLVLLPLHHEDMQDQESFKIFIVYAREDVEALQELRVQFIPVARSERLEVWYDGEILPGQHWDTEIKTQLNSADVILLFISKHFFSSEYIQSTELKEALARHEAGKSVVVPVIVRPCVWQDAFDVGRFQALPADAKPIFSSHWRDPDEAMVSVVEGVKRVVKKLRADRLEQARFESLENERIEKRRAAEKAQSDKETAAFFAKQQAEQIRREKEANRLKQQEVERLRKEEAAQIARDKQQKKAQRQGEKKPFPMRRVAYLSAGLLGLVMIWVLGQKYFGKSTREPSMRSDVELNSVNPKAEVGKKSMPKDTNSIDSLALAAIFARRKSGLEMVKIEGGSFKIGDIDDKDEYHPEITLSNYNIGKYEVTQADWIEIMGNNPSLRKCMDCPVDGIKWSDAQKFIEKANHKYKTKYRLPSESEWEFAAREKGIKVRYGNGKDVPDPTEINYKPVYKYCNIKSRNTLYRGKPMPVGSFLPNSLGLFDMSGNVYEICEDVYEEDFKNLPIDGNPRTEYEGNYYKYAHVIKGGAFVCSACDVTVYDRLWSEDAKGLMRGIEYYLIGFRLAHD